MRTWKENVRKWSDIGNIPCKKATVTFNEEDNTIFHNNKIGKQFIFSEDKNPKSSSLFELFKDFKLSD
ncbi:hypothetical protein [Enterocloster citroniae]